MRGQQATEVTVTVMTKGRVLDCVSFASREPAAEYRRFVRRWALEEGILIQVLVEEAQPLAEPAEAQTWDRPALAA